MYMHSSKMVKFTKIKQDLDPHQNEADPKTLICLFNDIFSFILCRSGSSHPVLHSQCESKNSKTSPVAALAPTNRARIKPCRDFNLEKKYEQLIDVEKSLKP